MPWIEPSLNAQSCDLSGDWHGENRAATAGRWHARTIKLRGLGAKLKPERLQRGPLSVVDEELWLCSECYAKHAERDDISLERIGPAQRYPTEAETEYLNALHAQGVMLQADVLNGVNRPAYARPIPPTPPPGWEGIEES